MDHRRAIAARLEGCVMPAPADALSRRSISMLAVACGLAVANANYAQPLLVDIGRSLDLPGSTLGLIPALTQLGVSVGIAFLLPLGDVMPVRRLLTVTIIIQAVSLLGMGLLDSPGGGDPPSLRVTVSRNNSDAITRHGAL